MEDELIKIVNSNTETGWSTTRRSWMQPGDIEFDKIPNSEPARVKTLKPINKRAKK